MVADFVFYIGAKSVSDVSAFAKFHVQVKKKYKKITASVLDGSPADANVAGSNAVAGATTTEALEEVPEAKTDFEFFLQKISGNAPGPERKKPLIVLRPKNVPGSKPLSPTDYQNVGILFERQVVKQNRE